MATRETAAAGSTLKRKSMTAGIDAALQDRRPLDAYDARSAYQCDHYLRWIARAPRVEAGDQRLPPMLDQLRRDGVDMTWRPRVAR